MLTNVSYSYYKQKKCIFFYLSYHFLFLLCIYLFIYLFIFEANYFFLINSRAETVYWEKNGDIPHPLSSYWKTLRHCARRHCGSRHFVSRYCESSRVGTILPARVNPPQKTRVYPGWAIRSYYPLWAICGFYEFLVLKNLAFQSDERYKSVEIILNYHNHILIS